MWHFVDIFVVHFNSTPPPQKNQKSLHSEREWSEQKAVGEGRALICLLTLCIAESYWFVCIVPLKTLLFQVLTVWLVVTRWPKSWNWNEFLRCFFIYCSLCSWCPELCCLLYSSQKRKGYITCSKKGYPHERFQQEYLICCHLFFQLINVVVVVMMMKNKLQVKELLHWFFI